MEPELPVLVVDDARFSLAIITRSLTEAGFRDVRYARSVAAALALLETRPADVVVSDWMMPDMDGIELTRRIRDMDELLDHYTYVMLLSGEEHLSVITQAFSMGVDDFVSKSALRTHLLPRIWAACRTAGHNNGLLASNRELRQQIATLERRNMIDPLTGLGNERFADRALSDILRHVASRGGAACVVLIALRDYPEMAAEMENADLDQVLGALSARLEQLVRPMDLVARIGPETFAVLMRQENIEQCTAECFRRIRQELDKVRIETRSGVIRLKVALAAGAARVVDGIPTPDELLDFTSARLREAHRQDRILDGTWRIQA